MKERARQMATEVKQLKSITDNPDEATVNPLLARTVQRTRDKAPKRRVTTEPQMRALRRIIGDDVLSIIPEDVREAVDAVHAFGKVNPEAFQYTPFATAEERNNALTVIRAYAEMAGEKGYTIYCEPDENPTLMIWKVTDRRTRKARGEQGQEG